MNISSPQNTSHNPPTRPNIIDIGEGKDFCHDWNERAKVMGADNVAAFGNESLDMFAEYHAHIVSGRIKTLLQLTPRDRVLELGCGPGRMITKIAAQVYSIIGVDVSDVMLSKANTRTANLSNVALIKNNGEDLENIPPASVDVVYSYACFIHIPEDIQNKYIEEVLRVLRPGGQALFHVRHAQTHTHVVRTFTGENFDTSRCSELAEQIESIDTITLLPIERDDDFVKDLNHRRWLKIQKK